MSRQRRTATLLAAVRHLETAAGDDVLDLLDQLLRWQRRLPAAVWMSWRDGRARRGS